MSSEEAKQRLAKVSTEMSDSILKESAELANELYEISRGMRNFSSRGAEETLHLVNRKLPQIVEKQTILAQEDEKKRLSKL